MIPGAADSSRSKQACHSDRPRAQRRGVEEPAVAFDAVCESNNLHPSSDKLNPSECPILAQQGWESNEPQSGGGPTLLNHLNPGCPILAQQGWESNEPPSGGCPTLLNYLQPWVPHPCAARVGKHEPPSDGWPNSFELPSILGAPSLRSKGGKATNLRLPQITIASSPKTSENSPG